MKIAAICFTLLILLFSCSPGAPQEPVPQEKVQSTKTDPLAYRICVLQDISKSADANAIPRIKAEHLKPVEDKFPEINVELAFGLITDKLPPPFIRFKTTAFNTTNDSSIQGSNNVFKKFGESTERQRRNKALEEQLMLYRSRVLADWQSFLSQLTKQSILQAGGTHIQAALDRASIYFDEQPARTDQHEFLLIATDGIDTSGNKVKLTIRPNVAILMVCSSQDIGDFQEYKQEVKLFESIESAVEYALSN